MIEATSIVDEGQDRLSTKLKNGENFQKLLKIFLEKLEEVEVSLIEIAGQKDLNTVTGVWLEYLGKIIGELRSGRDDDEYRAAIKLKIGANTSDGTPDIISELIQTTVEADRVRLVEGKIAWGQVIVTNPSSISASALEFLESIRASGVWLMLAVDMEDTAFYPAWELSKTTVPTLTQLEVVNNGSTLDFEIMIGDLLLGLDVRTGEGDDGGDTETVYTYLDGTTGRQFLEWEEPIGLCFFNGTSAASARVQVDDSTSGELGITGYPNKQNTVTALWEVDSTHTGIVS